jgi:uncharacterized membrane protein
MKHVLAYFWNKTGWLKWIGYIAAGYAVFLLVAFVLMQLGFVK